MIFKKNFKRFILSKYYIDEKIDIDNDIDPQKQRIDLLERNNLDQEKKDMWDD